MRNFEPMLSGLVRLFGLWLVRVVLGREGVGVAIFSTLLIDLFVTFVFGLALSINRNAIVPLSGNS